MNRIRILVVEDEFIIASNLKNMLEDLGYECLEPAGTYKSALQKIDEETPDLVILDINLEGRNEGIQLGKYLQHEKLIPFIYLTSNSDKVTILEAKITQPRSYLIKPFSQEDIYAAVEMAIASLAEAEHQPTGELISEAGTSILNKSLFVKVGNRYLKVMIEDITYIEADGKLINIVTVNQQKLPVKMTLEHMLELVKRFGLIRVQRSFLVNLKYLSAINGEYVYLGETPIPIGRQYKEELLRLINTIN